MDRRAFLGSLVAPALVPGLTRQSPVPAGEWGAKVFDLHCHLRPQAESVLAHLAGAGITGANLLTRGNVRDRVEALQATAPGRFTWFAGDDITDPAAQQRLTQAVKSGARGFGELKFHVAADGPELTRMYALAGELGVPILVHFQEVDHFPGEGTWATGYARTFDKVLTAHPRKRSSGTPTSACSGGRRRPRSSARSSGATHMPC